MLTQKMAVFCRWSLYAARRAPSSATQAINQEGVGCWSLEFGSLGLFDINRGPRAFLHIARAHLGRILCLDP